MKQNLRRSASLLIALTLLVSSLFGLQVNTVNAEGTVITVSEAISNNTGTATVEGYIVAHTTGTNSYDYEAPFGNDYNVALADAADEKAATKILPVQLSTNFRGQFGLQTNPGVIGRKIRVTGSLMAYFSVPGLKNPTAMEFVGAEPTPGTSPTPAPSATPSPTPSPSPTPVPDQNTVIKIADARSRSGQTVTVEGIVTADNSAIGGGKLSTFMQDDTAGINIYAYNPSNYPALKEGDLVRVKGNITQYKGLTEIAPVAGGIEVLQSGQAIPVAKDTSLADLSDTVKAEMLEGQLVKLSGYIQSIPSSPAGGGYNVSVIDSEFRSTTLRVMQYSMNITDLQQGKWYEITGILSQYDSYQVVPRKIADLNLMDPQPKAPSASGEYPSTVASVVDGDTIHLNTPVLGTTKVRFVNIDTPETYHTPVTEADISQKQHGEASKAYLNSLLKAGDEVILKVGDEATDDYGRLLAQVVRKSDNMNVNLEMVERGHASTYFLWPIGDEYEIFSQAVLRAYTAKLGIWNETNPLMELPFVFRAREQGKGLLRFVGNYYTKKYVKPEEWAKVPVEARVFFSSEEEAKANGYLAMGEEPTENIKVQLLGLNDLHGKIDVTSTVKERPGVNFGRADYMAAYLREREATNPNTLIMHSGDMVGGSSPVSALLQDEPTVEIMESIGFDIGTIGNHELDEGVEEMLRLINGGDHPNGTKNYDGMNFPLVCANMEYKATGKTVLNPYLVKEIGGTKIGFIGVITTATPNNVMPTGIASVRFTDEAQAINTYVAELKNQGVEAIVVLAHVSGDQSGSVATGEITSIANSIDDEVDVILAGHSHKTMNSVVDNKLVVQAWEYGNSFADIDLEIDPATKDIVKKSAEIVEVVQQNIIPDDAVAAILQKYLQEVAPKVNAVIGTSEFDMLKGYPTKGIVGDMALGNLIADSMKYSMSSDFALMNGGGVRDNINAGTITWGEAFNVQPFGNTLVKVDVTGKQFEEILNAMINPSYGPDSFIGGARYTWDTATNKVVNIYLENGEKINPDATYSLVVNNYMYYQTSNKYRLIGLYGTNFEQGPEDIAATVDFIKSFTAPIRYEADGRISTDIAAPVTTISVDGYFGEGQYNNTDVKVTFQAADAGIGVKYTECRINNGNWYPADVLDLNIEGRNAIEFRSVDKAGNMEATKSMVICIDKTKPLVTNTLKDKYGYGEDLKLEFNAQDEISGISKAYALFNGTKYDNGATVKLTNPGQNSIEFYAEDFAGNSQTVMKNFDVIKEDGLILTDGIYRARQVGDRVHIERTVSAGVGDYDADGDGWALVGRTNGAGENGKLTAFYVQQDVPYAIVKSYTVQMGEHYRLITPPTLDKVKKGQTRITPVLSRFVSNEGLGDGSTVQQSVYGAKQVGERVHILRLASAGMGDYDADGDGWAVVGRTNGAGENGTLVAFFVAKDVPFAVVKSYTVQKGWHYRLITPPSLERVKIGQTRITPVLATWPVNED
mgnify:CR=1 FL=1